MPVSTLNRSDDLRVYNNILEAVGKTPLIRLNRVGRSSPCPIYAKLEFLNPGGSVKDRIGMTMIKEAEDAGRLKPGGTVVESTSGNTGVGLTLAALDHLAELWAAVGFDDIVTVFAGLVSRTEGDDQRCVVAGQGWLAQATHARVDHRMRREMHP